MKTIEEFIELFAEQFDDTDTNEFTPETKFHDLEEWTSIIGLSVIAMVNEEFDVVIGSEEMSSSVTIEDLYNKVKAKAE